MSVPDRLSADSESPYYDGFWAHNIDRVEVNGLKIECVEYCISEGWAIANVLDSNGRIVIEGDSIKQERLEGSIKITERTA